MAPSGQTKCISNQSRRCRQCFAVKPLSSYLNKMKTSLCVICDHCRESQRKRYYRSIFITLFYAVGSRMKKINKVNAYNSSNRSFSSFSPNNSYYSLRVLPIDAMPSAPVSQNIIFSVPHSKWIPVKPFLGQDHFPCEIPVASLVYYPSYEIRTNSNQELAKQIVAGELSPRHVGIDD